MILHWLAELLNHALQLIHGKMARMGKRPQERLRRLRLIDESAQLLDGELLYAFLLCRGYVFQAASNIIWDANCHPILFSQYR